jgi:hypothetical protein
MILIWQNGCLYIGQYVKGFPVKTREAAFETGVSLTGARNMYPDERILIVR